jgi:hypothetical protein
MVKMGPLAKTMIHIMYHCFPSKIFFYFFYSVALIQTARGDGEGGRGGEGGKGSEGMRGNEAAREAHVAPMTLCIIKVLDLPPAVLSLTFPHLQVVLVACQHLLF